MKTIIWDWNGTLLHDLDFCISTINILLEKRKLPLLTRNIYKDVFSFPVKDYYQTIGFDFNKEDFAIPAKEFIDLYNSGVKSCGLHDSAIHVLSYFNEKGFRQFVLSAMKQNMLVRTLKHNSILDLFEGVYGLDNHYAVSKVERGKQLLSEFSIDKNETWMIGDTNHDYEVAEKLGIICILISDGHQSEERLKDTGALVISGLKELKNHRF
jgi:phosphoglycolate phosphatase